MKRYLFLLILLSSSSILCIKHKLGRKATLAKETKEIVQRYKSLQESKKLSDLNREQKYSSILHTLHINAKKYVPLVTWLTFMTVCSCASYSYFDKLPIDAEKYIIPAFLVFLGSVGFHAFKPHRGTGMFTSYALVPTVILVSKIIGEEEYKRDSMKFPHGSLVTQLALMKK